MNSHKNFEKAPIALFLYNRPLNTEDCLRSLMAMDEFKDSPLYIFIDGPKNKADKKSIEQIEFIIKNLKLSNLINLRKNIKNKGLANSIFSGVNYVLKRHKTIIVLEDDLIFHSKFLEFMNNCLSMYYKKEIFQISGFTWKNFSKNDYNKPILIPNISSWGWATWKDKWENFNLNCISKENLKMNAHEKKKFNLNNSYNYYKILKKHYKGQVNSWAIQWYYFVFKQNGYTIYPYKTLVRNNGFDGKGSHTFSSKKYFGNINDKFNISYPDNLLYNIDNFTLFCQNLKLENKEKLTSKIKFKASLYLKKLIRS